MEIVFNLCLPRDEASVPFVRHMCRTAMESLEVDDDCTGDIEVALSEACTNVLRHATQHGEEYEVKVVVDPVACVISILDAGGDFDHAALSRDQAASSAEGGRGVYLMQHLVDDLHFSSEPGAGTVVRLTKLLVLKPGSDDGLLVRARSRTAGDEAGPSLYS